MKQCIIVGSYWLLFVSVIIGGNIGVYFGINSLDMYQTPTIVAFMAVYTVAAIILMCMSTALCACLFGDHNDHSDHENNSNNHISIPINDC